MSVWKPTDVSEEPVSIMSRWQIAQIPSKKEDGKFDCHVVGYCYEGRVSSKIVEWDAEKRIAVTRSGRQYKLEEDAYGVNRDAQYVFGIWISQYGIDRDKVNWLKEPILS